jgi:hypothetical protein
MTIELPQPVGDYTVGLTTTAFAYPDGRDDPRRIHVTIYYPTDSTEGKPGAPYAFPELSDEESWQRVARETATHCYPRVRPSLRQPDFPVIIYNMGLGSHEMTNTVLCSDLASSGFVVASVGHPGTAAAVKYDDGTVIRIDAKLVEAMRSSELMDTIMPLFEEFKLTDENEDARLIEMAREFFAIQNCFAVLVTPWVDDTRRTADHLEALNRGDIPSLFEGRLRLGLGFGVTGHSFGGATAIETLARDARFPCGINMDGGHFGDTYGMDVAKPYLGIGNPFIWKMLKAVFLYNSSDSFHVTVGNTDHLAFCDSLWTARGTPEEARLGTRDTESTRAAITQYHLRFFERYLLKQSEWFGDLGFEDTRFYEKRAAPV